MSTRAEVLDEERKKAEASLEGLKSKLKNLEEVQSDEIPLTHMSRQRHSLRNIYLDEPT